MPNLRRYLLAGLVVTIPLLVTLYALALIYNFLRVRIGLPVERFLEDHVAWIQPYAAWFAVLVGLSLTLTLLMGVGFVSSTMLGRRLVNLGEGIVQRMPVVRWVYVPARQLVQLLLGPKQVAFRRVVMVPGTLAGTYVIGFVTSERVVEPSQKSGRELVNVFVPTSPTPMTGFMVMVPRDELIELSYSVEQGIKLIISGGVLTPETVTDETG